MEPFDIVALGDHYTIQPLISGNYEVYKASELIGFLTPTVRGEGTLWSSRELEQTVASEIGKAVEKVKS